MIPAWKLRRELARLVTQVVTIPRLLLEPIQFKHYRRVRWQLIKQTVGIISIRPKICIYLLYQPNSLSQSVIETCDILASKGYAVLVVANGGLQPASVTVLQTNTWMILERPNQGYDFGGFQDGVLFLGQRKIVPDHLLLLNDSIWFPMLRESAVIESLENSQYDVTGLLFHRPLRNEAILNEVSKKSHTRWWARRLRTEHIESYVTALRKDVFLSGSFQEFWNRYAPSSSKSVTIKRGEVGFSKAMLQAGHSVAGLSDRIKFLEKISVQTADFIEKTLIYAAYSDADLELERDKILAKPRDEGWLKEAKQHIIDTARRRRFNASFCWATEKLFGTSFVKKNDGMLFRRSRLRYLQALEAGDLRANNLSAIDEIRKMVERESGLATTVVPNEIKLGEGMTG